MGCFRKKWGLSYIKNLKKIIAAFTVKVRKKLKLNTEI